MKNLAEKVKEARIVAVLSVNDKNDAVDLANALVDGGIKAIELTLRTPNAFECASAIAEKAQKVMLGIGTVLTPDQAAESKRRGADFAVSPRLQCEGNRCGKGGGASFRAGHYDAQRNRTVA